MAELPLPEPTDAFEAKLVADVKEHGWHCVLVGKPPLAYTAGLWLTLQHPELLVEGDPRQAHAAIVGAVARIRAGERFLPGATAGDLRFGAVADEERPRLLSYASWLHGHRPFQAVRLSLPG